MSASSTSTTSAGKVGKARKILGITSLLLLPMLPAVLLHFLHLDAGIGTWMLGALATAIAAAMLNARMGLILTGLLALLSGVGYAGAHHAWLAALVMAVGAGLYGLSSRRGVQPYVSMGPIALAFIVAEGIAPKPEASVWTNAAITAGLVVLSGIWGSAIGALIGRRVSMPALNPLPAKRAQWYAVLMAVTLGIAMWFVSHFQWQHGGAWMLLTMLIVIQPYVQDTWRKGLQRVLGTILGFSIVMVIAELTTSELALGLFALGFLAVAMYVQLIAHKPYWIYATLLTPGIVIAESIGSSVDALAFARLGFTLAGAAVAFGIVAIFGPHQRKLAKAAGHDHY